MNQSRYKASVEYLRRAEQSIPLGSQTFSKSRTQYPVGEAPLAITRASGATVWDVDGNSYTDFVNSLAAVVLGYCDSDIDIAVTEQMKNGVIFSLPHPLEAQVAELLIETITCAEKVRFCKNGSDATAGAVRVARALTGRDLVIVIGYHGWQDWYIGSTARNLGVPEGVRKLTKKAPFNDLSAVHQIFSENLGQIAAVILEPMNVEYPREGYLQGLQEICKKNGSLMIFDETITGFRFAPGGAQELFGVTPDLATFGKGIANGYPLAAIVGLDKHMQIMEEIFFSFTYGGEALSLAAAAASIKKIKDRQVCEHLHKLGSELVLAVQAKIPSWGAQEWLSISGHPSWSFLTIKACGGFNDYAIKTLFLQEMFTRGFLVLGTHNISYAHTHGHIQSLLKAYDEVIPFIAQAIKEKSVLSLLRCKPLEPLFKVR